MKNKMLIFKNSLTLFKFQFKHHSDYNIFIRIFKSIKAQYRYLKIKLKEKGEFKK